MTKAKFFLGIWVVLITITAGAVYYFVVIKNKAIADRIVKTPAEDKLAAGEIDGWITGFADKNRTLYPATEFAINAFIGDKREEPFYAITLGGLSATDVGGIERKLANMGLLYVSDYDGIRYSFLILFEDKNAMMLSFNELRKVYPFAKQGVMPTGGSNL